MAHEVEALPGPGGRIAFDQYPWDEWLDGRVWKLVQGTDFHASATAMRTYVYRAAKTREVSVTTRRAAGGVLYIQANREAKTT